MFTNFQNVCIAHTQACTRTRARAHTHNEWFLDFIRNQETLAYLKDASRRQPRQTLKCFQFTRMRNGYFTQGVITYLVTYVLTYDYQLGKLCSTNLHVALYTLN